ncbi:helix-turn-helix transcriptional regulator [Haloprofundus salilacus]|uniref:helix-turn-helix transcriptional regulator n=1 Tax=Haloprofundus salilacus TaxID=2876190 RepID=UPI001CCCA722|nr:transcriptional regulator FilR1 domain-containing protein [Haloprofundus salilacus]
MQDAARFLADSPDRLALLTRLREGVAGPATLADDLNCARRSVQRNLAAFAERGWVERGDGGYRLTTAGDLAATTHADYLDRLECLDRFAPLLRHLDADHAPPLSMLGDADLVVASPENPQAPVHAYVDRLKRFEGDTVRMCSPVLSRIFHEAHASLAMRGVHTDLVLSEATATKARELNPMEFEAVLRVGVLDLYVHSDSVPFGLTVGEDNMLLAAYDEEGHLEACLASDDPDLLVWAGDLFERYRERSVKVELSRGLPFGLGS